MGPITLQLARARSDGWLLVLVAVVLAVTAGLAGAAPRLLDRLADASLQSELDDARVDQTGLAGSGVRTLDVRSAAAWDQVTENGLLATDELEPELREVLGPPEAVVDTTRFRLTALPDGVEPANDTRLTLRTQGGIDDDVTLVAGALPAEFSLDTVELVGTDPDNPVLLPVHQFVATASTAEALGLEIGGRLLAVADPEGPVVRRLPLGPPPPVVVELSGIVELSDRAEPVWFGDGRLHAPVLADTNIGVTIFAFGLVPKESIQMLPTGGLAAATATTYRWPLDEGALLDADADEVLGAARAMRGRIPRTPDELRFTTGIDRLLANEADRRATAVEVLGLAAAAVLGVGAALLFTLAGVLTTRRRDGLALVRGRGASGGQVLAADVTEALLLGLPAAVLATVTVAVVLPSTDGAAIPAAVVAGGLALLVLAGRPDARRPLGVLVQGRRRGSTARGGSGRVVVEGLVVLLAALAVVGLRQRGVQPDGDVDPLVIAAPVIATIAAALLLARLLPFPLRLLDRLASRRPGLGASVGIARGARDPRVRAVVPLVVVGVTVVGFAAAVDATVGAGQADAADLAVGADVRIEAQALATLDRDWRPPDPDAVVVDVALLEGDLVSDSASDEIRVLAVDAETLALLGATSPTTADLPELRVGNGPAPLIVSNVVRLAGSPDVGESLNVLLGLTRVPGTIVEIRPQVLGLDVEDGSFVVLDREAVIRATGDEPAATTRLVFTDAAAEVAASAAEADPSADVLVREEVLAELAAAPLSTGVRIGFRTAAAAAAIATTAAVLLQLAAGSRVRRREAAVLGAVGTPPATVRQAALAEVLPVVLGAALSGVALARGATALLAGRLDLSSFTGGAPGSVALATPPLGALVAVVLVAAVVAAVGVVATLGRIDMTGVLREEG